MKSNVLIMISKLQNQYTLPLEKLNTYLNHKNSLTVIEKKNLKSFVISKGAKDCGIMITIQLYPKDIILKDVDYITYKDYTIIYRIGIVDLDLKSPELTPLYIKINEKTIEYMNLYKDKIKKCYKVI